jgi:hypothetical protein
MPWRPRQPGDKLGYVQFKYNICAHDRAMEVTTLSDPGPRMWCPSCTSDWIELPLFRTYIPRR